jgi:putative transposase
MPEIIARLNCLQGTLSATTRRQASRIILALLALTGRVTMLGISRWAGPGGSYRSVQRFFGTAIAWPEVFWRFFRQHLWDPDDAYLLAGDEVVVTKAGKKTFGLERFFSSVLQKSVPGVAFFSLSLLSTKERRAFPVCVEQVVRTEEEKQEIAQRKKAKANKNKKAGANASAGRKVGRPKGSKNKNRAEVRLSTELQRIKSMLQGQLHRIGGCLPVSYLALDGHFGHNSALVMTRQCGLHLISKLRSNSALYLPYYGPYAGRGPHRRYGDKLDYSHLPERYLRQRSVEDGIETRCYHLQALHKDFSQPLNLVLLVKTSLATGAWAHAILFSSDLALAADRLVDYYALRFQIEFTFRDAKQHWGLEDFMNVKETALTNSVNLSLFMVDLSAVLLRAFRRTSPALSVLDLKAHYRGYKYVSETIKLLAEKPDEVLLSEVFAKVAGLGAIHSTQASSFAA